MTVQRRAFTLIELLTVIAITAILMTIIVLPIIDSFNLLRAGQGWSEAQERARTLLDRISREVAMSTIVRDNSGIGGQITVMVPPGPGSFNTTPIPELLSYAKMDLYKPAEGEPQFDAAGNLVYVDPVTGKIDPTLRAPKGQALLPATAGATLVRYFVALRNPFDSTNLNAGNYNDPYDGLLMARNGSQDNLFVLYRAEVQPYTHNGPNLVGNATYFKLDANNNPILDDPAFMIPDGTAPTATRIQAWLAASVIQTEVSRYDMVLPVYSKSNYKVVYDAVPAFKSPGNIDYAPRLVPLVQFRPSRISNEPATQQRTVRLSEESDNSGNSGPDIVRTQVGQWSNPLVRTYPVPLAGGLNPAKDPYLVGRSGTRSDNSYGFSIYQFDPTLGGDDTASGIELFDFTTFSNTLNTGGTYPFTAALAASNARSGWMGTLAYRQLFAPYQPDSANGQLLASFGIDEVGLNPLVGGILPRPNLPIAFSGQPLSTTNWSGNPAVWAGPGYKINDAFNYAWSLYNGQGGHGDLRPNIQRFIDLRVTANEDGTYGPLFPDGASNIAGANVIISGNQGSFARATIVPGSDQVWGPDQNAGPNYGNEIRYTRTTQQPGPNQYKINYVAQQQPVNPITGLIDYTMLGLSTTDLVGFNAAVYDPTNFVSATLQARYMPGYIQLNADPTLPLDISISGRPFSVFYRFEFTSPRDSFAVDYDSRQVMSLLLTLHDFPQTTLPNPQTMTLKTTATVRNFLR